MIFKLYMVMIGVYWIFTAFRDARSLIKTKKTTMGKNVQGALTVSFAAIEIVYDISRAVVGIFFISKFSYGVYFEVLIMILGIIAYFLGIIFPDILEIPSEGELEEGESFTLAFPVIYRIFVLNGFIMFLNQYMSFLCVKLWICIFGFFATTYLILLVRNRKKENRFYIGITLFVLSLGIVYTANCSIGVKTIQLYQKTVDHTREQIRGGCYVYLTDGTHFVISEEKSKKIKSGDVVSIRKYEGMFKLLWYVVD